MNIFKKNVIRLPFHPWYGKLLELYYLEESPGDFLTWTGLRFKCEIDVTGKEPNFDLLFKTNNDVVYFKLIVD